MNARKTMFAALMGLLLALGFSLSAVAQNNLDDFGNNTPYDDADDCLDTDPDMEGTQLPNTGCDVTTDPAGAEVSPENTALALYNALDMRNMELMELEEELEDTNTAIAALMDMDDTNDAAHITAADTGADAAARKAAALMRHQTTKAGLEDTRDDRTTFMDESMDGSITRKRKERDAAKDAKDRYTSRGPDEAELSTAVDSVYSRIYAHRDAEKAVTAAEEARDRLVDNLRDVRAGIVALGDDDDSNDAAHMTAADTGADATARKAAALARLKFREGRLEAADDPATTMVNESETDLISVAMRQVTEAGMAEDIALEARNAAYGDWRRHRDQEVSEQIAVLDRSVKNREGLERDLREANADIMRSDRAIMGADADIMAADTAIAALEDDDDSNDAAHITAADMGDDDDAKKAAALVRHRASKMTAETLKGEAETLKATAETNRTTLGGVDNPMTADVNEATQGTLGMARTAEAAALAALMPLVTQRDEDVVDPNNPAAALADELVAGTADGHDLVRAISRNFNISKEGIAGNAANIATNTANIATNTADIAQNRSMIEGLQEDVHALRSGIAAALAAAGMPTPPGEGWGFALGAGHYDGKSAYAAGLTYNDENTVYKVSVGSAGGETTVSAGAAWSF